ncbi:MAG: transglutaminase family protein [Clostridia bacterium]|nr:transglutaminase family protein [Clostridia bacterium]NCC43444.1 transglutaminase family protein [Clostridia bacterium]
MKTLDFSYSMQMDYENTVTDEFFTMRAIPHTDERQTINYVNYTIAPLEYKNEDLDCWGNHIIWGAIRYPHNFFSITVHGMAEVYCGDEVKKTKPKNLYLYKMESPLTGAKDGIRQFLSQVSSNYNEEDKMKYLECLVHSVYERISYTKGVTGMSTTAEQALESGCGVCQDYAHILIALLRASGLPARYVAGMMLGEGMSHAWVETYIGEKWIGLDPTNNKFADEGYIKIAHGRDATDCKLNKGVFRGGGNHTQTVKVVVTEV